MGQWWARLPRNTKIAAAIGGAAVTFLVYRWYKARQAAAASSSSSTTSTTGTSSPSPSGSGTLPNVTVTTPQGSYSGPPGGLGSVLPVLSGATGGPVAQPGTVPAPTTSAAPPPSSPSTAPNLPPLQTINGQQYYVLGQVGQPAPGGGFEYSGYNVGGGSQVYYGNQNGVAQGTPVPGGFAYTPVGNAGLISAQPTTTAEVIH